LEDEDNEDVEDQDAESSEKDDEDEDEVDPAVEASDNAAIDEVAAEADAELPPLTRAEVNLGRFAITKVSSNWKEPNVITNSYVDS
jgi:hypothetical protein